MNMISRVKQLLGPLMLAMVVGAVVVNAQPANPNATARPALEQALRQRLAMVTKQRLGLTDQQMTQLEQSNSKFAPQLMQLLASERETRRQLRLELTSPTPNQQHVSTLIDQTLTLQKQRVSIVEAEQKDLARFMTPVQRAKYVALQAEFRRRAQEMARKNARGNPEGGFNRGLKRIR
jgi:Spy/CpxP family protein refolding chaperone